MRALCLSGGGSKGAFQVGALRRLMIDEGRDYEVMTGVSVGALNIAGLGMTPYGSPVKAATWLEDFWRTRVNTDAIHKRWFPFGRLHALWEQSIYDSSPLHKLVHGNYFHDLIVQGGRKLSVGAVCMDTGEHRYVDHTNRNFIDWVLASSSYPVFFKPVEIDGKLWSDGGLKRVTPIAQAIQMGADEIDVIVTYNVDKMLSSWGDGRKAAVPEQVLRALDLMNGQIMYDDLRTVGLKNELAQLESKYKHIKVRLIQPSTGLGNGLSFEREEIHNMIEQGYRDSETPQIVY